MRKNSCSISLHHSKPATDLNFWDTISWLYTWSSRELHLVVFKINLKVLHVGGITGQKLWQMTTSKENKDRCMLPVVLLQVLQLLSQSFYFALPKLTLKWEVKFSSDGRHRNEPHHYTLISTIHCTLAK